MRRILSILAALWLITPAAMAQGTPSSAIDAIPNLALRLKASTLNLPDGTTVSVWPNSADPARNAVPAGGAPVYKTGIVNGKGVVRFARSHFDRLTINGGGIALSNWTIFIVQRTSGDCCFLSNHAANLQLRIGENGDNALTTWDSTQGAASDDLATPRTAWNVVEYRRDGPVMAFQEAGTPRHHGPWDGAANFDQIGALNGNAFLDGDIAELLIFSRKLTIPEEVLVYDYIRGEYAITPRIAPTALTHPFPGLPRLYSALHFQNAANIDFRALPVNRANAYQFTEEDVNPDLATFQAAVAAKIPNPAAAGYASLDLEVSSPGLLPWFASGYYGPPWTTTDRAYVIGLLDYARAARPNVRWGVYWHPYYDSVALRSTTYGYYSTIYDWFEAYTSANGITDVLGHCDTIQPELYPKDRNETQADSNYVASVNVQLAHDINDFYTFPQVVRETFPLIWVQVVPYALGGGTIGDFLTVGELTQRLIALRVAGADGAFIGGNAGPEYYTPQQWQDWADTTLTQALTAAGYMCYPNCDGSLAPPVLNINDFACFVNKFAMGDPYANCDHSTAPPILNINDFSCFINKFAAGCP